MTDTPTPYDAICAAVRRHHAEDKDGALLAVFLNRRRAVVLTIGIDEGMGDVDELFLRHLIGIVTDIGVAAVVFAVLRTAGRPHRVDKLLWHELSIRLCDDTTSLLDMIVIGESQRWSAASGRTQSLARTSAAARCPDRTAPSM